MDAVTIIIALFLIAISSLYWGTVLPLRLPELDRFFDRKPFNCRPCFTFHLTWLMSLLTGLAGDNVPIVLWGVALAFILFFITKIIDNKKITK